MAPDFSREAHPTQLLIGYIFKPVPLGRLAAVFDLDEVYNALSFSDYIDLADPGFPVAIDNLKALLF